jgi:hypothetical protein
MTKVTLGNGLRIGNFSSPHPFKFNTGEVLEGVDPDESRHLSLERMEDESADTDSRFRNVEVYFRMTDEVYLELQEAEASTDVDIILVPLPVKSALEDCRCWKGTDGKLRTCILSDRVNKTIHSDKFGV